MSHRRIFLISNLLVLAIVMLIVALFAANKYRQEMIAEHPIMDVAFEHAKHKQQPCASCHHNFVDGSPGSGGCYDCHKYSEEIKLQMESMFHNFCRDCHIKKSGEDVDSGPLRQCSLCHIDDQIVD